MVGYIYSEIRNIVTGLDKLNDLKSSYGSLGKRVENTAKMNDKYAKAGRKLNFIKMAAEGIESGLTTSAIKRIIQTQRDQKAAKAQSLSVADLNIGLKRTGQVLDKNGKLWKDTGEEIPDQTAAWNELKQSTKRFRMELLSIMFFGQMVARVFGNFSKAADEATGATKLFSTFWLLVGLPSSISMVGAFSKLIDLWEMMPGPMQNVISWGGRIVAWAGTLVGSIAAIELGWAGLVKNAPKTAAALRLVWTSGLGPLGLLIAAIMILLGLFTILQKKSEAFKTWSESLGNLYLNPEKNKAMLEAWPVLGIAGKSVPYRKNTVTSKPVQAASGGIFTRPTPAIIGEAGPEAVIPLSGGMGLGNVTYNVYASVNNDMDLRSLAQKLNQYLYSDMRRVTVR